MLELLADDHEMQQAALKELNEIQEKEADDG